MKKKVYIKISQDKYQFIEAIADSLDELAKMVGSTKNSIASSISHKYGKYEKVEIDIEEEREEKRDGIKNQ